MSRNKELHLVAMILSTVTLHITMATNINSETQNITISCPDRKEGEHCSHIKYAAGYDLELTCHLSAGQAASSIHWLYHNTTDINDLVSDRMYYKSTNTTSTLTIMDIMVDDTGNYTCITSLPEFRSQIHIETYVMPDYFISGMILLGINLGLCVLFIVCLTSSIIRENREKKKYDRVVLTKNDTETDTK